MGDVIGRNSLKQRATLFYLVVWNTRALIPGYVCACNVMFPSASLCDPGV